MNCTAKHASKNDWKDWKSLEVIMQATAKTFLASTYSPITYFPLHVFHNCFATATGESILSSYKSSGSEMLSPILL